VPRGTKTNNWPPVAGLHVAAGGGGAWSKGGQGEARRGRPRGRGGLQRAFEARCNSQDQHDMTGLGI
jgi:hypothetical protein